MKPVVSSIIAMRCQEPQQEATTPPLPLSPISIPTAADTIIQEGSQEEGAEGIRVPMAILRGSSVTAMDIMVAVPIITITILLPSTIFLVRMRSITILLMSPAQDLKDRDTDMGRDRYMDDLTTNSNTTTAHHSNSSTTTIITNRINPIATAAVAVGRDPQRLLILLILTT
jgi:hypothetical protein